MRYVRAVAASVIGLFVSDWTQTVGILLILVAGFVIARVVGLSGPLTGYGLAMALAVHLVITTAAESRRRRR